MVRVSIRKRILLVCVVAGVICAVIVLRGAATRRLASCVQAVKGRKTVSDRINQYGAEARRRMEPAFAKTGIVYPPARVAMAGLKQERKLEVWVAGPSGPWKHLKTYPILGMSGGPGPKLREGDMQVPEGLYRIESLNPNSLYHLALRVNYPNENDRKRGVEDGRAALGSDIMIHGKSCSIGCLAMGDEAAEELFVLAAETGITNISVVLSPVDFRSGVTPSVEATAPAWVADLYREIAAELKQFKK